MTNQEQIFADYDPKVIQQIFSNLMSNALKFTPAGGHVTVEIEEKDHFLHLKVKDTGEGIPMENQTQIFDRFHHAHG